MHKDMTPTFSTNVKLPKAFKRFPLRLQKGCLPDHVPLGKQILSAEPYRVCPTAQVKRTLLRTLKFPASLLAWAGVPGSPQVSTELPAMGDNQTSSNENKSLEMQPTLTVCPCACSQMGPFKSVWQWTATQCSCLSRRGTVQRGHGLKPYIFKALQDGAIKPTMHQWAVVTMPTTWRNNTFHYFDIRSFLFI